MPEYCSSILSGVVVGSANFDDRSFGIHDEVNLAIWNLGSRTNAAGDLK